MDVVMNWKCSVPVTARLAADDAPAGTASHKAAATEPVAAIAAAANEAFRFNFFPFQLWWACYSCDFGQAPD
jgi:hypothetical protein